MVNINNVTHTTVELYSDDNNDDLELNDEEDVFNIVVEGTNFNGDVSGVDDDFI